MIYDILDNSCWKCTSHGLNSSGYVVITINKKRMYGHRYMFEKYKVDAKVIRDIKNRKTWKHIQYPQPQY